MEELITASRGRRSAVVAPRTRINDGAAADPAARAIRRETDLVRSMTHEERVLYITNLLNTQVSCT